MLLYGPFLLLAKVLQIVEAALIWPTNTNITAVGPQEKGENTPKPFRRRRPDAASPRKISLRRVAIVVSHDHVSDHLPPRAVRRHVPAAEAPRGRHDLLAGHHSIAMRGDHQATYTQAASLL